MIVVTLALAVPLHVTTAKSKRGRDRIVACVRNKSESGHRLAKCNFAILPCRLAPLICTIHLLTLVIMVEEKAVITDEQTG